MSDGIRYPPAPIHTVHYKPGTTISAEGWSSALQTAYWALRYRGDVLFHNSIAVAKYLNATPQTGRNYANSSGITTSTLGGEVCFGYFFAPEYDAQESIVFKANIYFEWPGSNDDDTLTWTFEVKDFLAGTPTLVSATGTSTGGNGEQFIQLAVDMPSQWSQSYLRAVVTVERSSGATATSFTPDFYPLDLLIYKERTT